MAEEPAKGQEPKEPQGEPQKPDPDAELLQGAQNPDAVQKALKVERDAAKAERKRADAAEARAKEYEDRDKSEQQKKDEKAADADKRATDAELKALRYEVAAEKELPLKWASRLSGTTKKELEADADELVTELGPNRPDFDGGAREAATTKDPDAMIRSMAGR